MTAPGIEPGNYPRQGYSLPLAYAVIKEERQEHLKTLFLFNLY